MHQLIASPFLADHLVVRPGSGRGLTIPRGKYQELAKSSPGDRCPQWLVDSARAAWDVDIADKPVDGTVLVRQPSPHGYARASYELNLGCNYDCEHCYLGIKKFEGLTWPERDRLLHIMRDAGVLWLQLTGGEPLIDPMFASVYMLAYQLGMMLTISTNASALHHERILDLLTTHRPYRITISIYGATEATYDGLTKRRGSFKAFSKGVWAAHEAGLPMRFNVVVTDTNAHEVDQMRALADKLEAPHHVYSNISPTIYGGGEVLSSQSEVHLRKRKPFTGCNAGITHFHSDPFGRASICKVGRDPQVDLMTEGVEGLRTLAEVSESLMLRTGGCSGCTLSGTCGTCRPLAKLYQDAKAPLNTYCQHGSR